MDTQTLFQTISRKMRADFDASAQVLHSGSKGTVRESILRKFLAEGRLPAKYGLGAGEIVGRVRDTSRQCDIVVYDKLEGVTLLYDENTQVYPIDCVYGIIEVKSALSKIEFVDSLNKIAAFKVMAPKGATSQILGGGLAMVHARPSPFGMIFAYELSANSLDSLVANLREWEESHDPALWPNYVCVLEEGVIYHHGKGTLKPSIDSSNISKDCWPTSLRYKEDSLFQFYSALHDLCTRMKLGPVELLHYYKPLERIGPYLIGGHVEFTRTADGRKVRLSEVAIHKIVSWCSEHGSAPYKNILIKQFGAIPQGMEGHQALERQAFLYNPGNLPGLHELGGNPVMLDRDGARLSLPSIAVAHSIEIDSKLYIVSMEGLSDADYDEVSE